MPRLKKHQWEEMRLTWETEPSVKFIDLARQYNVNVSAVSRWASREGWEKIRPLQAINDAAQRRADARTDATGNRVELIKEKQKLEWDANTSYEEKRNDVEQATRAESEAKRADLVTRHRTEWAELEGFRRTAMAAMKTAHEKGDRGSWGIAKTAAETAKTNLMALEIKQAGEARAWGLDAGVAQVSTQTVAVRFVAP